jgi:Uncharacterized conserved protein
MSVKPFFIALIVAGLIVVASYCSELLTIDNIKSHKLWLNKFIDTHYLFSVFIFFISCLIFINTPVPFAAVMKVLSGFFFGFYMGAIYNIAATTLACLAGFSISRYAFKTSFERFCYLRLKRIEDEVAKNGFYYFLTLRLIMVAPYFMINILAGVSRISFRHYLFSTLLGVIPMSLVYANGGNQLERITTISELFKTEAVLSLLLIALLSIAPIAFKNRA